MKILVVDDDFDQLMLRCLLLQRKGFKTVQAGDAASAVALARCDKPDCAVLDLRLPDEGSGLRLIRDLKEALPGMKIIVFTGLPARRLADKQELALVHQIIEKNAGPAVLIRALKDLTLS
jgi:two-component system response regulator RegA